MAIKDAMTHGVKYIPKDTTLVDAAKQMRTLACGFLPVSDLEQKKLLGVVTDRDIVVRAVAEGLDPTSTTVADVLSTKVLYCYEDDDLEIAAAYMRDQCVYRLVVLDNKNEKNLVGIISLGDLIRSGQSSLASEASEGILAHQAA